MVTCGGGPGLCATWEVSREYSGIPIPIVVSWNGGIVVSWEVSRDSPARRLTMEIDTLT